LVTRWLDHGLNHLYLVGCGGSYATTLPPKWIMDRFSTLPVDRYSGYEFLHRAPARLNERAAVVLGSHSGTTEEILESVELAHQRGASTVALTEHDTLLTQHTDDALTYKSPATNLSKLLLSYLVAIEILSQRGELPDADATREALLQLPDAMHNVRTETEQQARERASAFRDTEQFYVVGTGPLMGLAYQFTVCNLLEMQWIDAAAINAAEFQHGPLEIVRPGLPMIFLLGADESRPVTERALAFAQRYEARTIVYDLQDMPDIHPWFAPFGLHLPLQWLNWYLGVERDHPISTRRYMGKVAY
jgi:fructoselysine-6-P-deglycase FrlB-like protein